MRILIAAMVGLLLGLGAVPASAEREYRAEYDIKPAAGNKTAVPVKRQVQPRIRAQQVDQRKQLRQVSTPARAVAKKVVQPAIDERFKPQVVPFEGYAPGTIVIDTANKYLYLVESVDTARRYGVAVGVEGLQFKGKATIRAKQEWPRWVPTANMIKRSPEKYARYKDGMKGGPNNPLGARALYLYKGNVDTHIRIHGTNQPGSIGSAASNGCFRMVNEHVIDLYQRVKIGTEVVVM